MSTPSESHSIEETATTVVVTALQKVAKNLHRKLKAESIVTDVKNQLHGELASIEGLQTDAPMINVEEAVHRYQSWLFNVLANSKKGDDEDLKRVIAVCYTSEVSALLRATGLAGAASIVSTMVRGSSLFAA